MILLGYGSGYGNNNYSDNNVQMQILSLQSQLSNAVKEADYYKGEYNRLSSGISKFCNTVASNEINRYQLGGNTLNSIYEIMDFVETDIISQKKKFLDTVNQLQNTIDAYKKKIDSLNKANDALTTQNNVSENSQTMVSEEILNLKNRIQQLEEENNQHKRDKARLENDLAEARRSKSQNSRPQNQNNNSVKQSQPMPKPQEPVVNNTPKPAQTQMPKPVVQQPKQTEQTSKPTPSKSVAPPVNISVTTKVPAPIAEVTTEIKDNISNCAPQEIISILSDKEKDIIIAMGESGCSDAAGNAKCLMDKGFGSEISSKNTFLAFSKSLCEQGIMSHYELNFGPFRRQMLFWLTDLGLEIYKILSGKDAVIAECLSLKRDHDNFNHGYLIKYIAEKMEQNGKLVFNNKETVNILSIQYRDRTKMKIDLPGGVWSIPDIVVAVDKGDPLYFEVELGTTLESDFFKKCDKMMQITKTLFFVGSSGEDLQVTEDKFYKWLSKNGGKESLKGYSVIFATAMDIARNKIAKIDF